MSWDTFIAILLALAAGAWVGRWFWKSLRGQGGGCHNGGCKQCGPDAAHKNHPDD